MPQIVPFTFWTARLTGPSDHSVCTPLLEPSVMWTGDESALASAFEQAASKKFLENGLCSAMLKYAAPAKLDHVQIAFDVAAAKDAPIFPRLDFTYDAFVGALPTGDMIGFVPALGVEAVAKNSDELRQRLIEAVRLEFARRQRLSSVHLLLGARWFGAVELQQTKLELPFYGFKELEEIQTKGAQRLLPDVARQLVVTKVRTFELAKELEQVERGLRGRFRRSVLVVGASGGGKSALIHELARTYDSKHKIWAATAGRLLQKLTRGSGWQENLTRICHELRDSGDLLYIENLADLFEVGQYEGNSVSLAEYLRPFLERGDVLIVSECTAEEAARLDVRAPGYLALFQQVRLTEPPPEKMDTIVRRRIEAAARDASVTLERDAIDETIRLHRRFMPYSGFPGKAIRFLEGLVAEADRTVERRAVTRRFCEDAGMPDFMVDPDRALPIGELERHFQTNVYGQNDACSTVVDLLAAVKTNLSRGGKPIASLLFTGPTGVGKTELAKVLAGFMFGRRERMIRFDMTEFADPTSVLRLTGDTNREGLLTGAVRRDPFSVLLFDEVEKAHPVFFDMLLQVLGEGRLTDARGRLADFCSSIVIMTSNVGAQELPTGSLGFGATDDARARVLDHFRRAVEEFFRPELFNRLDRVVAFAPLDRGTVRRIVEREMKLVQARPGLLYRDVDVHVATDALDRLAEHGYDALYGARQLQRTIRSELVVPLAKQLNRYAAGTPLEASASVKDGALSASVRGLDRKAAPDREIGATGLTLKQAVELISNQRRLVVDVLAGTCFVEIETKQSLLERMRKKLKEKLWIQSAHAREYEQLARLIATLHDSSTGIEWLESEAVLALVDPGHAAPADLWELFSEHKSTMWTGLVALYDTAVPESRQAMLGIYGPEKHLRPLAKTYEEIARGHGIGAETHLVWLLPEPARARLRLRINRDPAAKCPSCGALYSIGVTRCWSCHKPLGTEAVQAPPCVSLSLRASAPAQDARVVGVEIAFTGPLAWPLIEGEGGLHYLRDRDGDKHHYVLIVGNTPRESFAATRPEDVHRQTFLKGRKERRKITPDGFVDEPYKADSKEKDYAKGLAAVLRPILEATVIRHLRGEAE